MNNVISKLIDTHSLSVEEYESLLNNITDEEKEILRQEAVKLAISVYGKKIFARGLIEFSNYCKNNCYYCGIRCANKNAERYRLIEEEILTCCDMGYSLGFRTFVLQGGEDPYFEGMFDELNSQVALPSDVEAPKYNLQDFVQLRMETIIDDGRICCVEWEQLITKRGREERYRLSEPGISFYERAADGWLKSIRIIDYANTERRIDWDNCPYDRETAEKINYMG